MKAMYDPAHGCTVHNGADARFLVAYEEDCEGGLQVMSALDLIVALDNRDAMPTEYRVYAFFVGRNDGRLDFTHRPLKVHEDGTYIAIVDPETGEIVCDGYGTDH